MMPNPRSRNRREQILAEAARLFADRGYPGTSVRQIADACGITQAALYRYFSGKEELYESAISWKAGQHDIAAHLAGLRNEPDVESVLRGVAEHILDFLHTDPELLNLTFSNCIESGPVAAVLFREVRLPYIEFIARELDARIARGEVRPVDTFITARCFVGMVMDCALSAGAWSKVGGPAFNAQAVVANNVPIFSRGLACVTTPPAQDQPRGGIS